MTPAVICIDPSMAAIGWAVGVQAPTLAGSVVAFGVYRVGVCGEHTAASNVADHVQRALFRHRLCAELLVIERPAGGMRADYGSRSQAEAAEGPAWVGGLCCAHVEAAIGAGPLVVLRPRSYDWRPAMLEAAQAAGIALDEAPAVVPAKRPRVPVVREANGSWRVNYPDCGHVSTHTARATMLAEVQRQQCPACATEKARGAGQQRTDEWKARAWRFASGARPDIAGAILADAEGRARTTGQPWERVGVADACEAAGMVPWALRDLRARQERAGAPAAMLGAGAR